MIYIKNEPITEYQIITDNYPSSNKGCDFLIEYLNKQLCFENKNKKYKLFINRTNEKEHDYFHLYLKENNIYIEGGKRGVIYGVFDFLEKECEYRFLTPELTYIPNTDIYIEDFDYQENSIIKYREICGYHTQNDADSLVKQRLFNVWDKNLSDEYGNGIYYASTPCHTMTGEYFLRDYLNSKPEIFSLVDGKRTKGDQICFSNNEINDILLDVSLKILDNNKDAKYISISQGDNEQYCTCDECKKLYEKYSLTECFLEKVNYVAKGIKEKYPDVLVHTLAYGKTKTPPRKDFKYEDNIIIQYCNSLCVNHSMFDDKCERNIEIKKTFDEWSNSFKNILIWDYPNCFGHQLIMLPNLRFYRELFNYYSKRNVTGVFMEYNHAEGVGSCVFGELKTYLFKKLLWNPLMSEEEFEYHKKEFMKHYYGKKWIYIGEYIDLYENSIKDDVHPGWGFYEFGTGKHIFDFIKNKEYFFKKAYELFDKAKEGCSEIELSRIENDEIGLLYLDSISNFDDAIESKNEELITKYYKLNETLINKIIEKRMKITFYGETIESQIINLKKSYKISPREWNYKWN